MLANTTSIQRVPVSKQSVTMKLQHADILKSQFTCLYDKQERHGSITQMTWTSFKWYLNQLWITFLHLSAEFSKSLSTYQGAPSIAPQCFTGLFWGRTRYIQSLWEHVKTSAKRCDTNTSPDMKVQVPIELPFMQLVCAGTWHQYLVIKCGSIVINGCNFIVIVSLMCALTTYLIAKFLVQGQEAQKLIVRLGIRAQYFRPARSLE